MIVNAQIPVCSGGWNARDAQNQMKPGDAIIYDNVQFKNGTDTVRRGYRKFLNAGADMLFAHHQINNDRLLANKSGVLYVYDNEGTLKYTHTPSPAWLNMMACTFTDGAGVVHKFITNNESTVYDYKCVNGTDSISAVSFTGTDGAILQFPFAYKNRLYFIEKDTCRAWYSEPQSISGALTSFNVGPFFKNGGHLIALGSWTQDGGDGTDDQLVLFSSQGECLVYSGLSPNDTNGWNLVGRYEIPKIFNYKSVAQIKGDLILATTTGVYPLSGVLSALNASGVALSDKINNAFLDRNASNTGWKIIYNPNDNEIMINSPSSEPGLMFETLVWNAENNTWSRYLGHNMTDMCVWNDGLYFCRDDGIYRANVGYTDDGYPIKFQIQPAYSHFGVLQRKQIMRANLHVHTSTLDELHKVIWTDFRQNGKTIMYRDQPENPGDAVWDSGLWNSSTWVRIMGAKNIRVGMAHNPAVYISVGFIGSTATHTRIQGADVGLVVARSDI